MLTRVGLLVALFAAEGTRLAAQVTIRGNLAITEKGGKQAADVGDAVVWLEGGGPVHPRKAEIATEKRQFLPHVVIVPVGSSVAFSNHDPFNHNVFSLSEENPFDLGLYGRGEIRAAQFGKPGIARVYCNVHAQMAAFVIVRDNPWFTQPSADGSFTLAEVPPGTYQLRVWHERGGESSRPLEVPAGGIADLRLTLDARGFKFTPHPNKFGKPYETDGRRY